VVIPPLDERVTDIAIRPDRAPSERPVLAAVDRDGLDRGLRAALRGLAPGRGRVIDREGDVLHAVAMAMDVLGDLAVG